ncbi:trihelix transcription factor GTL1-like [Triticum dicoccoides]|uniref:trihelix transcription factor GTL1-like n=1 Tax=Triticum dicoccoides TaxID=85692 RepID=UPI001890C1D9|nr:trihelix transcription factor GTL1-like [Triticum dicoccoides]
MQSGYGGVSEFQQFIMDGGFAMAAAPQQQAQAAAAAAAAAGGQELGAPFRYQPLHHHAMQHHHQQQQQHPAQMPPHFAHFGVAPAAAAAGGIPFTQQFLNHQAAAAGHHHQQHHHLQLFHHEQQQQQQHHKPQPPPARWAPQQQHHQHPHQQQQHHHHQLGLDVEAAAVPESSRATSGGAAPPGVPPFLAAAMNFKLAVDPGGGSGATDDALNDGTGGGGGAGSGMMLHGGGGGDDEAATESRLRRWTGEEETSIKEPTWRPLDIDYIHSTSSSSKRAGAGKEKVATPESPAPVAPAANYFKKAGGGDDNAGAAASAGGGGGNYKLFSELEAIYKPGSGGGGGAGQTGSGSGLTGDDNAILPPPSMADLPGGALAAAVDAPQANTSETSAGEDAPAVLQPQPPPPPQASVGEARRKRKRRRQEQQQQLTASASFFEQLVQRLIEHQEGLHRQFLDAMERRERERAARDEAWRRQEADKFAREAAARAQDRASAAARETAIIAYLEKLSGETITLPQQPAANPAAPTSADDATSHDAGRELVPYECGELSLPLMSSSSRWPKHEVEALIRVRSGLDNRFQEPGLKGPLWEEVSARMAAAGYGGRSAKRCKEKWENINKYFRKAKESGKKRPAHAKTCPYFDELDRLYSRSGHGSGASSGAGNTSAKAIANAIATADDAANKASSELLDAVVKYPTDTHYGPPPGFPNDGKEDGAAQHDGEGDVDMGRASGRAGEDHDDEAGQSHGHDDDDDH